MFDSSRSKIRFEARWMVRKKSTRITNNSFISEENFPRKKPARIINSRTAFEEATTIYSDEDQIKTKELKSFAKRKGKKIKFPWRTRKSRKLKLLTKFEWFHFLGRSRRKKYLHSNTQTSISEEVATIASEEGGIKSKRLKSIAKTKSRRLDSFDATKMKVKTIKFSWRKQIKPRELKSLVHIKSRGKRRKMTIDKCNSTKRVWDKIAARVSLADKSAKKMKSRELKSVTTSKMRDSKSFATREKLIAPLTSAHVSTREYSFPRQTSQVSISEEESLVKNISFRIGTK